MYVVTIKYFFDHTIIYEGTARVERHSDIASVVVPNESKHWQNVAIAHVEGKFINFVVISVDVSYLAGCFKLEML